MSQMFDELTIDFLERGRNESHIKMRSKLNKMIYNLKFHAFRNHQVYFDLNIFSDFLFNN